MGDTEVCERRTSDVRRAAEMLRAIGDVKEGRVIGTREEVLALADRLDPRAEPPATP